MSKDIAIKVEKLGKEYIIGHQKSGDLRNSFNDKVRSLFSSSKELESFWALKNVDFDIKKGEAVGIIGRNGAGKSTLLKILSRITEPTSGRFEINGRVSSLLEVGTGFHMELTGRENIYLNGTILGMKRAEIKAKFDEIVEFSGVAKFLDTPVKHYSSGMKVRLAFSVAAHLEPDILIVDEVLAVGDAEFQKKCLGKMDHVSKSEGRTIIFVSHNMAAVQKLCENGILLKGGVVEQKSLIKDVISTYVSSNSSTASTISLKNREDRINGTKYRFSDIKLLNINGIETDIVFSGDSISFNINIEGNTEIPKVIVRLQILDSFGIINFTCNNYHSQGAFNKISSSQSISCIIDKLPLNVGNYQVNLQLISDLKIMDEVENALQFKVESGFFFETGNLPNTGMGLLVDHNWEIK